MTPERGSLGLGSGIGLVAANMIGVGVMLSAGFMALHLDPGQILLCWVVGGVMAMAGARAYAAVAAMIPRSGGEYRYLSDLLHPAVGYLAGWTSFLAGFTAPVAVTAATLGPFAGTIVPGLDPTFVGAVAIVAATLFHALDLQVSRIAQDVLVVLKMALVVGFVLVGVVKGSNSWPTWEPLAGAEQGLLAAFMGHLVWVTYAYSGWNAAVYAAGEFRDPRRTVPRAMVIGCAIVAVLYLLVNWVFVANLAPADFGAFLKEQETQRITLGHLITSKLLGDAGGKVMSAFVILALLSSISAMTFVGPRVYAAMAGDGYLPKLFAARAGKPPMFSVFLQGAIALGLFLTHSFSLLVKNVGAILSLASALTVVALFRVALTRTRFEKPAPDALVAGAIYLAVAGFMLWYALEDNPTALLWMAVIAALGTAGYFVSRPPRP